MINTLILTHELSIYVKMIMATFLSYYNVTQMTICAEKWRKTIIYYY